MTEAEWFACADLGQMLDHLAERPVYDRKILLFGCACCRLVWELMPDERSREAVRTAERYADAEVSEARFTQVTKAAHGAVVEFLQTEVAGRERAAHAVLLHAADAAWRLQSINQRPDRHHAIARLVASRTGYTDPSAPRRPVQQTLHVAVLRDIFGTPHPFPQHALAPSWLTSDVLALARGIYDDHAFDRMPILADALQDAGCDNSHILDHCRGAGPHVRGCWVVDALLGKA